MNRGRKSWQRKPKGKKRNPGSVVARLSPAERRELAAAQRLAKNFHGTTAGQVVELSAKERKLSRFAVVAGELADFTYRPGPTSKRAYADWNHQSGDRGAGKPAAAHKPVVVVDPKTKRPAIVAHRSPMRFSSKQGFVG